MLFSWDDENREHIAKHDVTPEEAEEVVRGVRPPFPGTLVMRVIHAMELTPHMKRQLRKRRR